MLPSRLFLCVVSGVAAGGDGLGPYALHHGREHGSRRLRPLHQGLLHLQGRPVHRTLRQGPGLVPSPTATSPSPSGTGLPGAFPESRKHPVLQFQRPWSCTDPVGAPGSWSLPASEPFSPGFASSVGVWVGSGGSEAKGLRAAQPLGPHSADEYTGSQGRTSLGPRHTVN